jgi:translation initiation factor eIF-2B subunit epsilon
MESYLRESRWNVKDMKGYEPSNDIFENLPPKVFIVRADTIDNAGDALREIADLGVIKCDPFILVSGDVISNMNLSAVIAEHKSRRKTDKEVILTSVMKEAGINHPTRTLDDDLIVAMCGKTNRLLMYNNESHDSRVMVDHSLFIDHPSVKVRYDLLDCHIDICSPDVLDHFRDNYDYRDIRQDYMHNEVQNKDMGYKFFAYLTQDQYAARIQDPRTYDTISQNILQRWTFPLVPDANLSGFGKTSYSYSRGNIYIDSNGQKVHKSCEIKQNTAIAAGVSIGQHSKITASVIGANCKIGKNVTITGSYIWPGVTIEDNVTIDHAIVCDGAIIKAGAKVKKGCIISYDAVIGGNFTVAEFSRITLHDAIGTKDDEWGTTSTGTKKAVTPSSAALVMNNPAEVGTGGKGRLFSLDELFTQMKEAYRGDGEFSLDMRNTCMGNDAGEKEHNKLWDSWEGVDLTGIPTYDPNFNEEEEEEEEDEEVGMGEISEKMKKFVEEVKTYVLGSGSEDSIAMEINCYKMSENKTFAEVSYSVLRGIFDLAIRNCPNPSDSGKLLLSIATVLKEKKGFLEKFAGVESDFKAVQFKLIEALIAQCRENTVLRGVMAKVMSFMYKVEILSDPNLILEWYDLLMDDAMDPDDFIDGILNDKELNQFLDNLREEEESEEEEEESEEEEEEEDDEDEDE